VGCSGVAFENDIPQKLKLAYHLNDYVMKAFDKIHVFSS